MKCKNCDKKAEIVLKPLGQLCRYCYSGIIEKRVRKHIRINDFLQKNDKVIVFGNLSYYFIKKVLKNLPLEVIKVRSMKQLQRYGMDTKKVVEFTLDDEINLFLNKIFTRFEIKKMPFIKILMLITDEEAVIYSKYHRVNFKPNKKDPDIKGFIDGLEEIYPDMKYGLARSIVKLENMFIKHS